MCHLQLSDRTGLTEVIVHSNDKVTNLCFGDNVILLRINHILFYNYHNINCHLCDPWLPLLFPPSDLRIMFITD